MMKRIYIFLIFFCTFLYSQDEFTPLGSYSPNFFAELLDVEIYSNDLVYAVGVGGFIFVDINDVYNPKYLSRYSPGSIYIRFYNGHTRGDIAAGAARLDGLYFIDISNLNIPKIHKIFKYKILTSLSYESVVLSGNYAYAAAHEHGVQVINIENVKQPAHVKLLSEAKNAWDVYLQNDVLYVADAAGKLWIYSITEPSSPVLLSSVDVGGRAIEVIVEENFAFVAKGANGFTIVDVEDERNPQVLSHFESQFGILNHLEYSNGYIFAATWELVMAVDVRDPSDPVIVATEDTPDRAMGIAADGDYIFVTDWYRLRTYFFKDLLQPDIHIKPTVFDFGFKGDNIPISKQFDIYNLGSDVLDINKIEIINENYSFTPQSLLVQPGQKQNITVTLTPPYDSNYSSELIVESNDPDEQTKQARLFGGANGLAPGDKAPNFKLEAVNRNEDYSLAEQSGKVVVLAIFASW